MALILWMTPWVEEAMLNAPTSPDLHSVELFSGKAANTKGVEEYGLNAIGYDKLYSSKQNIITEAGFRYAISLILRLKPGGSVWAAPKCSSWIFMCTSHSKRCGANPTGDTNVAWVREGNEIAKRTIALLMLAVSIGAFIYMEQPTSSFLPKAQPNLAFIQSCMRHSVSTSLGAFGAETQKNVTIWSNDPKVSSLYRKKGKHQRTLTHRSTGGSVTGKKKDMTKSEAYPKEFGQVYGELVAHNYYSSILKARFTNVF